MGYFSHPGHLSFSNLTNEPERVHTTYNDRLLLIESTPAIQSVSCWPIWTVNTTQNQATRALTANSTLYGILNILCMREMEIYNFPCAVNGKKNLFLVRLTRKEWVKKKISVEISASCQVIVYRSTCHCRYSQSGLLTFGSGKPGPYPSCDMRGYDTRAPEKGIYNVILHVIFAVKTRKIESFGATFGFDGFLWTNAWASKNPKTAVSVTKFLR